MLSQRRKKKIRQTTFEEPEEPDTPRLNKLCCEPLGLTEASTHPQAHFPLSKAPGELFVLESPYLSDPLNLLSLVMWLCTLWTSF